MVKVDEEERMKKLLLCTREYLGMFDRTNIDEMSPTVFRCPEPME